MQNTLLKTTIILSGLLLPAFTWAQAPFSYFLTAIKDSISIINTLMGIILALSFIFFLWGMATFILNSGNEEKREEGKKKMIWGIIILTVMVSVWGIIYIISTVFFGSGNAPDPTLPTVPGIY